MMHSRRGCSAQDFESQWGAVNVGNNISRWVGGVSRAETRINFWHYTEVIVRTCSVSHPSPSYIYDWMNTKVMAVER